MAVAMHPWSTFIDTKVLGDIFMIQLKTGIDEETRKVRTDQRYKQTYGNCSFEHLRKFNGYLNVTSKKICFLESI